MTKKLSILAFVCVAAVFSFTAAAQQIQPLEILPLSQIIPGLPAGDLFYDPTTKQWTGTNGIFVSNGQTSLTADSASVDSSLGDVIADGHVRIESGAQVWIGDHINYNFKTKQMRTEQFRTGKAPVFAGATGLTGDRSNDVYTARSAFVTSDDFENPALRVRSSKVKLVPGKYVEMWNAVLWAGKVPIFYFPYYHRNLGPRSGNFNFTPGYRTSYGGYLLTTYEWYLGEKVDGVLHADYRTKRGVGLGPDVNLHLGQWGEVEARYYYLHDVHPDSTTNDVARFGETPNNRQRVYLSWQATPATNLNFKALVNYQTDPFVLRDFFGGEYDGNPQPNSFFEVQKYSDNWSLDVLAAPRVNNFFSQVERLPDVKLTGYRQQILDTPLYYDSESSIGWFRAYGENATNGFFLPANGIYTDAALRADTHHQITLPWMFFNWLRVEPRVGGRFTYYNRGSFASDRNDEINRAVFNTGIGLSFKSSALWTDAKSSLFDVDGLRHIIEPSVNYTFVPRPSTTPETIPQFDSELQALLLNPITFSEYNSIDSIDAMNVIRFGLRNVLQTKRAGQLENIVDWNLMLDARLDHAQVNGLNSDRTLNDLYSQFVLRPRNWLTLEEQLRYDILGGHLNLSFHQISISPNDRWSWGLGHLYLRAGTWGGGTWEENDFLTSTAFYRLNDNWGMRMQHNFNIKTGKLQQQYYSVYRDLRSFVLALTFRVQEDQAHSADYTVALQFSLKAHPLRSVGNDVVNPYRLVGE